MANTFMQFAKINHSLSNNLYTYVIFISDGIIPFNDSLVYYDVKIIKTNNIIMHVGDEITVSELDITIITDEDEIHNLNKLMVFE